MFLTAAGKPCAISGGWHTGHGPRRDKQVLHRQLRIIKCNNNKCSLTHHYSLSTLNSTVLKIEINIFPGLYTAASPGMVERTRPTLSNLTTSLPSFPGNTTTWMRSMRETVIFQICLKLVIRLCCNNNSQVCSMFSHLIVDLHYFFLHTSNIS